MIKIKISNFTAEIDSKANFPIQNNSTNKVDKAVHNGIMCLFSIEGTQVVIAHDKVLTFEDKLTYLVYS